MQKLGYYITKKPWLLILMHVYLSIKFYILSFQPLFIALSQIWTGFQDEVVLLSVLSNLLNSMSVFTKVHYHDSISGDGPQCVL